MFEYLLENHSLYTLFKAHWIILFFIMIYLYFTKLIQSPLYFVTKNQQFYFFTAVVILLLMKGTPLDVIGTHYLFSVHTLQLASTYFIVIPLLILSVPIDFIRKNIWHHQTKLIVNILAHPFISLIAFNGLLSIYFIPTVFKFIQSNLLITIIAHIILFISAVFMWFVIINPLPEIKNLSYLTRALYLFVASVILFPIGFFYIIVQTAHFPAYMEVAGDLLPSLTATYDQQVAGGVLKIIQIFSYAYALLIIAFKWGREEEAREGQVDEENVRYVRGVVIHLDNNDRNR